jgi:predicted amidohydrolase YtcJ
MELVLNQIPPRSKSEELAALSWAHEQMLSHGITAVQDAWIEPGMTEVYLEALAAGLLKVRTNLAFRITPENWESSFEYFLEMREKVQLADSPMLTAKTVKFFADGVLGSGTAAVLEPYDDFDHHGEPVWRTAELERAARKYASENFQLHIHAIGDAGVRTALDVIESVVPTVGPSVIAHTELVQASDIARFGKLNVVANFEPLWARKDGMLTSCIPHIGERRIDQMYRMRTFIDSGATISFGSDWPVSSVAPLLGIQTAVTRAVPGEPGWTLEEAITPIEAIAAYTSNARLQTLDDFEVPETVLLSANPAETPADSIHQIKVIEVRRGEKIIWRNEN